MNKCEYDRGLDPYVDITDEDEGIPSWAEAFFKIIDFFGNLFGRR